MNAVHSTNQYATAWKTQMPQSAMSNFSTDHIKSGQIFPDQAKNFPKSFTDSLGQIDAFKGKYRDAKYQLIASVYLACQLGFKTKAKIDENNKILSDKCKDLKIDGRTYYQKLGKIAFGDDSKRVSSIVHVIKVAEKHSVEPDDFVEWLKNKGGVQKIRTTYNVDGTTKDGASTKANDATQAQAKNDQYYIDKGKASLTSSAKATIPVGQLSLIDSLGNEGECTAILRQRADGSFDVKVVLNDKNLVEQLYCAHGRTLPAANN
ncbi:hypothetical protein [Massilia timonae]|uniref:hypothetical protein n=1 Tax=Massilia timonae TaxID=47229 RepID=UPI0028D093EF|nr:hypothetical protein [Massilia timonae]